MDVVASLTRRSFTRGVGPVAALVALAPTSVTSVLGEAAYPSRPVRILVTFLPAGAAGRIGTCVVVKSDPDGHTLLMTTESSLVIAPHIGVSLGYDPRKDFAP